jgi:hypothetical protein
MDALYGPSVVKGVGVTFAVGKRGCFQSCSSVREVATYTILKILDSLTNIDCIIESNGVDEGRERGEWGSWDGEAKGCKDAVPSAVNVCDKTG